MIPAVVFVISEPQFSRCHIWIPLTDKLYFRCPETFFFLQWILHRVFWGEGGIFIGPSVNIYHVCKLFCSLFEAFSAQPVRKRQGGFVFVCRCRRRCFSLWFFCTLLPYMALWMTGTFHKDLTCIWSPVVSEGSYFEMISTDKKWDYSSDSFDGFFLMSISKNWGQQNVLKTFVLSLFSYIHIFYTFYFVPAHYLHQIVWFSN